MTIKDWEWGLSSTLDVYKMLYEKQTSDPKQSSLLFLFIQIDSTSVLQVISQCTSRIK